LGRLYLNAVDRILHNQFQYTHCRYVDDIRIFCDDYADAKRALVHLSELLRRRGLSIQTAKSAIHNSSRARIAIDGITPVLQEVQRKYVAKLPEVLGIGEYMVTSLLEELLDVKPDETPIDVLRATYQEYFIGGDPDKFDKTLFHFLIKRLARAKDKFAVEHCKSLLEFHPEETAYVLDYFAAVGAVSEVEPHVAAFIESKDAVYHYQIYQVLEWVCSSVPRPSESILASARKRAFDSGLPPFLRAICRKLLADFGSAADLELLEHAYSEASSPFEQSEIICCLRRMEKGRRNAFLARAQDDHDWNRIAVKWVKGKRPSRLATVHA
jgi:hypothetical protein